MKKTVLGLLACLVAHGPARAEGALPVLEAHSTSVDVRDGTRLLKGVWIVDSTSSLDVYESRTTTARKRVSFFTDVDSLTFDVRAGRTYDFIIRLDGRHDCRTRISTMTQSFTRTTPQRGNEPATLPITIERGKLHVRGTVNGSRMLDLIFDTGADINVLYPSALKKGAELRLDGTSHNTGTGGTTVRRTSHDNRLEVAGLRWDHESVLYVEKQADAADGIVGYPVFQDRTLEIDYDRMVMVVHDSLPAQAAAFARTPIRFSGSLTTVEVELGTRAGRRSGWFVLDTGGTGTAMVNAALANRGLRGSMTKLGTSRSGGVGSGAVRNEVDLLPELRLAGFTLRNLPIHVELPTGLADSPPRGTLCMEVLRRFNTILDYSTSEAYFRPNHVAQAPFDTRPPGTSRMLLLVACLLVAGGIVWAMQTWNRRTT